MMMMTKNYNWYKDEEDKVSEDDGKTFANISDWTERASKS